MRVFDTIRGAVAARQNRSELQQLDAKLNQYLRTATDQQVALVDRIVTEALDPFYPDEAPGVLAGILRRAIVDLINSEGVFDPSPYASAAELSDVWRATEHLKHRLRFFQSTKRRTFFELAIVRTLTHILDQLPLSSLFSDEQNAFTLTTSLDTFLTRPADAVQGIVATFFDDEITRRNLVLQIRGRLERNLYQASGIDPERAQTTTKSIVLPKDATDQTPAALVSGYLAGTTFADLLALEVPFSMPQSARYTHQMVTGGSGHGKSQLLQQFLLPDLAEVQRGEASVVVIDSQGDMLNTITHLAEFDPDHPNSLADRLVLIDPNDIEAPPCLNLFDVGLDRLDTYNALAGC